MSTQEEKVRYQQQDGAVRQQDELVADDSERTDRTGGNPHHCVRRPGHPQPGQTGGVQWRVSLLFLLIPDMHGSVMIIQNLVGRTSSKKNSLCTCYRDGETFLGRNSTVLSH